MMILPAAWRRAALSSALCMSVCMTLGLASAPAAHATTNGPDPTLASLTTDGPYTLSSQPVQGSGFGGGTVYTPNAPGTYALVALCPGFLGSQRDMQALGMRLATHGFVVVTINTLTLVDFPSSRATQLLAALKTVSALKTGPVAGKIDRTLQAVGGWSMGGGGALEAASTTPKLSAAVAFAPWNDSSAKMKKNRVPTAIIGGSADTVAPVREHSAVFYAAIPRRTPKLLGVIRDADHGFPATTTEPASYMHISWMKRFADGDTRYSPLLQGDDPALSGFISNGPF